MRCKGVRITVGSARGNLLISGPLSFYGGVDPDTGIIVQADHPRRGECVTGRILVLPRSTGSTVGSWTLLRMVRQKTAPAAIVSETADEVLVTGTLLGGLPHLDGISLPDRFDGLEATILADGDEMVVAGAGHWPEPSCTPPSGPKDPVGEEGLLAPESPCVVKLGGSLVTFKGSPVPRVDFGRLAFLCRLLAEHVRGPLVLVHGAGSFGHGPVSRLGVLKRPLDAASRLDWSSIVTLQFQLNAHVCSAMKDANLAAFPLQASALGHMENGMFHMDCIRPVQMALDQGFVPVLYGTPCLDTKGRPEIASGDDLVCELALALGFPRIIHLTAAGGVHSRDPSVFPDSPVIPLLSSDMVKFGLGENLSGMSVTDVTGGMRSKVQKLITVAEQGVLSWIVDGRDSSAIARALCGRMTGTVIRQT